MKRTINIIIITLTIILILAGALGVFLLVDISVLFGEVNMEEIIFNLNQPINGVQSDIINNMATGFLSKFIPLLSLYFIGLWGLKKFFSPKLAYYMRIAVLFLCMLLISLVFWRVNIRFDVINYFKMSSTPTTFFEENYIDGHDLEYNFPEEKRNLIYILSESLESTYLSREAGGAEDSSLMPNLEKLATDHVTFNNGTGFQGARSMYATTWTASGILAQTAGVPLKTSLERNEYGSAGSFAPGVYSLGEVLGDNGYTNYFRFGSESSYANRDIYLQSNGDYIINDYITAKASGEIPEDYYEWWGYEDAKLFEFAKNDLKEIIEKDEPFNYSLLTADTHSSYGYDCPLCIEEEDERQYARVIRCQDRQIAEFIQWIQEQDIYEQTTIIVAGDHLSMDTYYFTTLTGEVVRTPFYTIINGVEAEDINLVRDFSTMDFYPTTLASMGIEIEGDKIGLGTNLYSEQSTILEKIGFDEFEEGLKGYSVFYNKEILGM